MSRNEQIQAKLVEIAGDEFIRYESRYDEDSVKLDGTFTIGQLEQIVKVFKECST